MSLASKCMEPAFRMHLRAHSTVAKFFQALKDAPSKAVRIKKDVKKVWLLNLFTDCMFRVLPFALPASCSF